MNAARKTIMNTNLSSGLSEIQIGAVRPVEFAKIRFAAK
jgi:hypothetical protein